MGRCARFPHGRTEVARHQPRFLFGSRENRDRRRPKRLIELRLRSTVTAAGEPKRAAPPERTGQDIRYVSRLKCVRALRAWVVYDGRLVPLTRVALGRGTDLWPARKPATARCLPFSVHRRRHVSPDSDCTCSIYGGTPDSERELLEWAEERRAGGLTVAWGTVDLWGTLISESDRHRAEFAYPRSIRVLGPESRLMKNQLRELLQRYGIDSLGSNI